jgi:putative transposase
MRDIQPGKPNQNAFIERFNRTYHTDVLHVYLFENLEQVPHITWNWLRKYNEQRPHRSIGRSPPAMFRRQLEDAGNSTLELSA